jgi:gluconolactonase
MKYRTIAAEVFARLPDMYRKRGEKSPRIAGQKHQPPETHSFLEGPAVDAAGNLYFTDVPFGRVFRATPGGEIALVLEYDGEPCGLKLGADGAGYIADAREGLLKADLTAGTVQTHLARRYNESFRGLNDLTFAKGGDLYFTDQGLSDLRDPTGRVYSLSRDGRLHAILENGPSPNGIALSPDEATLYVAMTRANAIWRLPLMVDGSATKVGAFINLSGGIGPDGIAVDQAGGLIIAHPGLGVVWVYDKRGEPILRIESPVGDLTTNVAFGGSDYRTLYITESHSGTILTARLDTPGVRLLP